MRVNDLLNSNNSVDKLLKNIYSIAEKCKSSGVKNVFISAMVKNNRINDFIIQEVNRKIYDDCQMEDYSFIINYGIGSNDLLKDSLHLLDRSKKSLANFVYNMNSFLSPCRRSNWAGNISLNILGNNFDNDIFLKDLFSDDLTKRGKYEETHASNSEKSKDKSIEKSSSIMQLKNIRLKDINRVIIGNLNLNSPPIKFAKLQEIVLKYVDILILIETKLGDSFPASQFMVDGFPMPYRQDRNRNRGGIMIYIRDNVPSKLLTKHVFPDDIEGLFVELNFRKSKWLLMGAYHPPSQSDSYFFEHLDKALDIYSNYEKVLLTGDFNSEIAEPCMDSFLYQPHLSKKKRFKSMINHTCIDLFLTNSNLSFQHTETVPTGLSDFHMFGSYCCKDLFFKNEA